MHAHMNARAHACTCTEARDDTYVFILTVVYVDLVLSQPAEELRHPRAAI